MLGIDCRFSIAECFLSFPMFFSFVNDVYRSLLKFITVFRYHIIHVLECPLWWVTLQVDFIVKIEGTSATYLSFNFFGLFQILDENRHIVDGPVDFIS